MAGLLGGGVWRIASTYNPYPRITEATGRGRGTATRYPHRIGAGNPKVLRAVFNNCIVEYTAPYERQNLVDVTIQAMAIERVSDGATAVVYFPGGSRSAVMPAGAVDFQSADIPASVFPGQTQFTSGDWYNFKLIATVPNATDTFPSGRWTSERTIDQVVATRAYGYDPEGAKTMRMPEVTGDFRFTDGSLPSFCTSLRGFTCILIGLFDDPKTKAVALTGDSIAEGDSPRPPFARVAAEQTLTPMVSFAVSSATSACLNSATPYHRAMYKYTSALVDEFGTNDRTNHTDGPADYAAWKQITGRDTVYKHYLTPRSSSTDGWLTEANQTPVYYTGDIEAYNAWIDSLKANGTIKDIFRIDGLRGVNFAKWKEASPALTTDGLHPTAAAAVLEAADYGPSLNSIVIT